MSSSFSLCSDGCEHLVSGIMYYMAVQFIARSISPSTQKRMEGNPSVDNFQTQFQWIYVGSWMPFVKWKKWPWPRLLGAEMALSARAESNWAVIRWTKSASAPSRALGKCKQELHGHTDLHYRRPSFLLFGFFFPYRVQVLYHGKISSGI